MPSKTCEVCGAQISWSKGDPEPKCPACKGIKKNKPFKNDFFTKENPIPEPTTKESPRKTKKKWNGLGEFENSSEQ